MKITIEPCFAIDGIYCFVLPTRAQCDIITEISIPYHSDMNNAILIRGNQKVAVAHKSSIQYPGFSAAQRVRKVLSFENLRDICLYEHSEPFVVVITSDNEVKELWVECRNRSLGQRIWDMLPILWKTHANMDDIPTGGN